MKYIAIIAVVFAAACQRQDPQAVPKPSKVVVDAIAEYCRISEIPKEQWLDAQKAWGWHWASDKVMGPLWVRVAKQDRTAIAVVLAAADQGAGVGKCPVLDELRR